MSLGKARLLDQGHLSKNGARAGSARTDLQKVSYCRSATVDSEQWRKSMTIWRPSLFQLCRVGPLSLETFRYAMMRD